jgi:ornithine cyclodeaminase/alanine dehydrogenase-like protein (mu-crystallin family)
MSWVLDVERAYVGAATNAARGAIGDPAQRPRALAAIGAVASRYLAVGTPRTFGTIVATPADAHLAQLSLDAHATWFAPREVRHVVLDRGDAIASALACDIVCVHAPIAIRARDLRRGTHVNALAKVLLAPDLIATIVHEVPGLGELAAGLVDGRQLDEITVFVAGDIAIALAALS